MGPWREQDLLFVWKLTSDPKMAAQALAPQLRDIAEAAKPHSPECCEKSADLAKIRQ